MKKKPLYSLILFPSHFYCFFGEIILFEFAFRREFANDAADEKPSITNGHKK